MTAFTLDAFQVIADPGRRQIMQLLMALALGKN
jgi:hypothetical protein